MVVRRRYRSRRPFMLEVEDFEFMDDIDAMYADFVEWTGDGDGK